MDKILIVDDETLMLDGLERIIGKISGLKLVAKFQNGMQAKKYLESHPVDIIFSDVRMPVMDGLELARWLSLFRPECRIVLISAYREFEYARRAMNYGVRYFLTKPYRFEEVKGVVSQIVEERRRSEKSLLWKQDLKCELQEVELYHALMQQTNPIETSLKKKLFYAEYKVCLPRETYENRNQSNELLRVGLANIFRWCAPLAIPILKEYKDENVYYVLLAENVEWFPDVSGIQERIIDLMEMTAEVHLLCCVDAKEIILQKSEKIEQDEIADQVIIQAKEYIAQNLAYNISRTDVATVVHLESSYFGKYFKKKVGLSFQDYLLKQRMEKVKHMLRQGCKVKDAMRETGYQNRNYFNQVFKQYTGCNPSEFIRKK